MNEKTLDFSKELENSLKNIREPRPNSIIKGKIVSITPVEVFVDIDWTQEIVIPIEEFPTKPILNDFVTVYCYIDKEGELRFSKIRADQIKKKEEITEKYKNNIPVEGKINGISKDKKVIYVDIDNLKAVCYSDDLFSEMPEELNNFIGKEYKFLVKSISSNRILVSHREYIANQKRIERDRFFKEHRVGNFVEGVIKNIVEFEKGKGKSVEVDLGGFSAFVPEVEVSYSRYKPIEEVIINGEKRKYKIIKLDKEKNKIFLSIKQTKVNPWITLSIRKNDIVKGIVREVTDNGIVIEIEDGVTGFVSKKDFSWFELSEEEHKKIKIGSYIEARVLDIDKNNKKLSLGIKQLSPHPFEIFVQNHNEKTVVKGKITRVVEYGFFVQLDKGVEGLLHKNELSWTKPDEVYNELSEEVGKEIDVLIDEINKDKRQISLSLKKMSNNPWEIVKNSYPVNSVIEVVISDIEDKKMRAAIIENIEGVIPISEASLDTIYSLKDKFKIGDKVTAIVKKIEQKKGNVLLSIKDYLKQQQESEIKEFEYNENVSKVTFADLIKK